MAPWCGTRWQPVTFSMVLHAVILPVSSPHRERAWQRVEDQRLTARRALIASARLSGGPVSGYAYRADGAPIPIDGWHWSVSHKRHYVVAVMAREAVGVDVEAVCPREAAAFAEIASATEWALLPTRDDENFLKLWTAKEAVTKAIGKGLAAFDHCALTRADTAAWTLRCLGKEWSVEHVVHADHLFAIAGRQLNVTWHVGDARSTPELL